MKPVELGDTGDLVSRPTHPALRRVTSTLSARLLFWLLLIAAVAFMAWLAVYQVDDAFILYRYVRNIALGHGIVFNLGERVEGVSCFLWTMALVPFAALGLDLPKVAPVLTAVCGLAVLSLVAKRSAEVDGRSTLTPTDLIGPVLLAFTPSFAYWAVGALETVPYALALTLAVSDFGREMRTSFDSRGRRSAIWLGIASLIRPETPLIVAAFGAYRAVRPAERASFIRRVLEAFRWGLVVAAFFVPFLLFRRFYFGEWLPNTYFAKMGSPLGARIGGGRRYLQQFVTSLFPSMGATGFWVTVAAFILLVVLAWFAMRQSRLHPEALLIAALCLATVIEGGDWMVLNRLFVPVLPSVAIVVGAAIVRWMSRGRWAAAGSWTIVGCVVLSSLISAARVRDGGQGLAVNAAGYRTAHVDIARYLHENGRPGDAVALMDIGMIGWYAPDLNVIDITGLTDHAIARAPGGFLDKRASTSEILGRKPRYIVLVPDYPADQRIAADPSFLANYKHLFTRDHRSNWVPLSSYELRVYERNAP